MLAQTKGQVQRLGEDEADKEEKFLPPTLVTDVDTNDAVMQQEVSDVLPEIFCAIFGFFYEPCSSTAMRPVGAIL